MDASYTEETVKIQSRKIVVVEARLYNKPESNKLYISAKSSCRQTSRQLPLTF
jgi:hypothetical protein